jgi:hypothetical protein
MVLSQKIARLLLCRRQYYCHHSSRKNSKLYATPHTSLYVGGRSNYRFVIFCYHDRQVHLLLFCHSRSNEAYDDSILPTWHFNTNDHSPVNLGDYGALIKGTFVHYGNMRFFATKEGSRFDKLDQVERVVHHDPPFPNKDPSLTILNTDTPTARYTFNKKSSVFFYFKDMVMTELRSPKETLADFARSIQHPENWSKDYYVVTGVVCGRNGYLLSKSPSAKEAKAEIMYDPDGGRYLLTQSENVRAQCVHGEDQRLFPHIQLCRLPKKV